MVDDTKASTSSGIIIDSNTRSVKICRNIRYASKIVAQTRPGCPGSQLGSFGRTFRLVSNCASWKAELSQRPFQNPSIQQFPHLPHNFHGSLLEKCSTQNHYDSHLMATLARPSPPRSPSRMPRRWARKCERYCCIGVTYFPLVFVYGITTWAVWVEASIGFQPTKSVWIGEILDILSKFITDNR